ncbi:MAG: histidine kinase [Bacteroidota bacterium]
MNRIFLSILFLFYLPCRVFPQDRQTDSLLQLVRQSNRDTNRVNNLNSLISRLLTQNDSTAVKEYLNEVLQLALQLNFQKGIARSYINYAHLSRFRQNYLEMLRYDSLAEQPARQSGDKETIALYLEGVARASYNLGNYYEAAKMAQSSLTLWKELDNIPKQAAQHMILGGCYNNFANTERALQEYYRSFKLSEQAGDKRLIAYARQLLASGFIQNNELDKALEHLMAAQKVNNEIANKFAYAQNCNTIGEIYLRQEKYSAALQQFQVALKHYQLPGAPVWGDSWSYRLIGRVSMLQADSAKANNNKQYADNKNKKAIEYFTIAIREGPEDLEIYVFENYQLMGIAYTGLGRLKDAKNSFEVFLKVAKKVQLKSEISAAYRHLSIIDSIQGNFSSAFQNMKKYILYRDSIDAENQTARSENYKLQFEFEKNEQQLKLLESENKLKSAVAAKQKQQKLFAYAGVALIFLVSAYGFYRYRRISKMKTEQKILKDRLTISQDLHDHVGSTLSSISVFSKVAQVQGEQDNKTEMQEVLSRISETSTEMMAEMNDIVWAINPGNDNMEKIIQRMESFAKPLTTARGIQFVLKYDPSILSLQLDMEKRKNFYLIFKEAVNNAIKYSGAKELSVTISKNNNTLQLLVKDNGVGFNVNKELHEPSLSLSGNGLRNMRARAGEMNATLKIDSLPGSGTGLLLSYPLP